MDDNQDSDNQESRFERIKRHIKENKTTYLVGGVCLGAGYFLRQPKVIAPVFNNTPVIAPVMNNIGNQLVNAGPCCKIVQRLEDEELWGKIKDVVEELSQEHDVPAEAVRRMMNRHFRGELEDVFGKHYERIATRTAY